MLLEFVDLLALHQQFYDANLFSKVEQEDMLAFFYAAALYHLT